MRRHVLRSAVGVAHVASSLAASTRGIYTVWESIPLEPWASQESWLKRITNQSQYRGFEFWHVPEVDLPDDIHLSAVEQYLLSCVEDDTNRLLHLSWTYDFDSFWRDRVSSHEMLFKVIYENGSFFYRILFGNCSDNEAGRRYIEKKLNYLKSVLDCAEATERRYSAIAKARFTLQRSIWNALERERYLGGCVEMIESIKQEVPKEFAGKGIGSNKPWRAVGVPMSTIDMIFDGALASSCATLFSNPFDVMLTRMQLQGEMMRCGEYRRVYTNTFQGMYHVAREEGILALQRGLASAVSWQVAQNGVRIGMYPLVKVEIERHFGGSALVVSVVSSALCGVAGAFLASPFMLVKIRLQSKHDSAMAAHLNKSTTGEQYNYNGVVDGLRKIYRKDGIRGLWQGVLVASQRTMVGSMVQLTSYDMTKAFISARNGWSAGDLRVHVISAFVSAMCITALMTPLNVVMTRCYSERSGEKSKYSTNIFISSWRVYRVEGVFGLYKGAGPLFSRMAPHTILTFVFLEHIRKLREKYTDRSYTSGSVVKSTLRFRQPALRGAVEKEEEEKAP